MSHSVRFIAGSLALLATFMASNQRVGGAKPSKDIELTPIGVYRTLLFNEGAAEIAAYDPETHRAFLTFAARPRVEVVDLTDPAHPFLTATINLTPWGPNAHATSVAVHNGVLAVAVPQGVDDTAPGRALFFDAQGLLLSEVTVGALPDMITFTPNGALVLTANEGQPTGDYLYDPEGSVSIIDVRAGVASLSDADVTTAGFSAFNSASLDPSIRIFGPGATVAQDLEPEYIAVSHDSKTAWVTLQENNALGIIDLKEKKVIELVGLGYKDHSVAGNGLDGNRDDRLIRIKQWPIRGMYQPDGLAVFKDGNLTYLVTANEGDVREYDGLNDAGEESVEIEDIYLDSLLLQNFPDLQLRTEKGLGRLKVTSFQGDTDGDGDYDELYSFGARSFSIRSSAGALIFDSGDVLEQLTALFYPDNFNASNSNNTKDDRSDDKGPEPEGVTVARLFGRQYLFVMLERIGGVVVYELTDPTAPRLVQYVNTRNFGATPGTVASGDLGPEAARVVDAESSPTGTPLLIVSNEASGTLRVFEIAQGE